MNAFKRLLLLSVLLLFAVPGYAQKTTEPQPMALPGESTEPPKPSAAPVAVVMQHELPRAGGVLVFGSLKGSGLDLVKVLTASKIHVTVVTTGTADNATLTALGANAVPGDVHDPESLKSIFTSAPFRAVVSTIGEKESGMPPEFAANKNVIDATKAAGIPRLILVSTLGVGDSANALPWYAKISMKMFAPQVVAEDAQAEGYVSQSGLDYTVIRPGGLSNAQPSDKAVLIPDHTVYSQIARADLGKIIAICVDDETTIGKTLSAFDPTRVGFMAMLGMS